MSRHRQSHCMYGHEFTPENTYAGANGRQCKACRAGRARMRRAAPGGMGYQQAFNRATVRAAAEFRRRHPEEWEEMLLGELIRRRIEVKGVGKPRRVA